MASQGNVFVIWHIYSCRLTFWGGSTLVGGGRVLSVGFIEPFNSSKQTTRREWHVQRGLVPSSIAKSRLWPKSKLYRHTPHLPYFCHLRRPTNCDTASHLQREWFPYKSWCHILSIRGYGPRFASLWKVKLPLFKQGQQAQVHPSTILLSTSCIKTQSALKSKTWDRVPKNK